MSTYKGVNKTKIDDITPATIVTKGEVGGVVRVMYDTFVVATAVGLPDASDVIEMCDELPLGARVIDVIVYNGCASATLAVGDLESTTRYHSSVTNTQTHHTVVALGMGYKIDMTTAISASTPDNQIILTPSEELVNAEIIRIAVLYTVE